MVHRRELEGQELVLGNQGALWGNAMTWWDHDTGSVWSQPLGRAILGPREGEQFDLMSSTLTEWASWRARHPETLALDAPGGVSRFSLHRMVIVVDFGAEVVAYPVPDLRTAGVVNDVVAGTEIAVVIDPEDEQSWSVMARRLDDEVLTLAIEDSRLIDRETGTVWDPTRSIGLEGPLAGEALGLLPGFTAFPRDFDRFWPDGRVWVP